MIWNCHFLFYSDKLRNLVHCFSAIGIETINHKLLYLFLLTVSKDHFPPFFCSQRAKICLLDEFMLSAIIDFFRTAVQRYFWTQKKVHHLTIKYDRVFVNLVKSIKIKMILSLSIHFTCEKNRFKNLNTSMTDRHLILFIRDTSI